MIASALGLLLLIPTVILFSMWLYAAYRNLGMAGSGQADETPGWAVGYFFIPFVNLFRPYQIVKELSLRSADGNEAVSRGGGERGPMIVKLWWTAFILSGIVSEVGALAALGEVKDVDRLEMSTQLILAGNLLYAAAGALAIAIVLFIDRTQALFREPEPPLAAVAVPIP